MTTKDDGGPAAPVTIRAMTPNGMMSFDAHPGMTLRDWFAGQALAGSCKPGPDGWGLSEQDVAVWAYAFADAMLAERNK